MDIITETPNYNLKTTLNESDNGNKEWHIEGIFQESDKSNKNNRTYPHKILEREVSKLQSKIDNNQLLMQLEHPTHNRIDLNDVCMKIEELNWQGNQLYGKALILNTKKGDILKELCEKSIPFGVSSRGTGSVDRNGIVENNYNLITFDCVSSPSINHFVNGIYENYEIQSNPDLQTIYRQNVINFINEL